MIISSDNLGPLITGTSRSGPVYTSGSLSQLLKLSVRLPDLQLFAVSFRKYLNICVLIFLHAKLRSLLLSQILRLNIRICVLSDYAIDITALNIEGT